MPLLAASILIAATTRTTNFAADPLKLSVVKVIDGLHPIAFASAPTGSKFALTLEDGSVRIMDATTRQTVRPLAKHPQPAYAIAWSPDGKTIATGDETARIWIEDAATGKKVREYRTHTKGIQKLSFNAKGNLIISTGKDDQVNVYDLSSPKPKEVRKILGKGQNVYGATFNPKSDAVFAVGLLGGGARFYDATTGNQVGTLVDPEGQGVFDVAFSSNGARCFTAGRDSFAIEWDSAKKAKIGKLKGHADWVVYTALSPNGKYVATASSDRLVKIWNTVTLQKVAELPNQNTVGSPLCFTADGNSLISVNDAGSLEFNSISPSQAGSTVEPKATGGKRKRHHRRG